MTIERPVETITRSTTVIIQNRDGSIAQEPRHRRLFANRQPGYYAAIPSRLLDEQSSLFDRLISFAFDTLGTDRLEVRVYDEPNAPAQLEAC
jgi:hypothetical protein